MITELLQRFIAKAETHVVGEPPFGSSKEIIVETLGDTQFQGLDVKASFGMGRATAVPWIGFFDFGQKTEKGIYPVFLYFKEQRQLVLAYGVSETNSPDRSWVDLNGKKTIREYFAQHELGVPARYGNSFVQGVYDTTRELDEAEIDRDLNTVIAEFRSTFEDETAKSAGDHNTAILNALEDPRIKELIADPDFRFEKARKVMLEFESLTIDPDFFEKLWREYDSAAGDFNAKLNSFPADSREHEVLLLIGRLISYCDAHAANKNILNEYPDKRTIAKSFIRQGTWMRNLIGYKASAHNRQAVAEMIGNALAYLKDPTSELTMLSEKHREMVSKNLLRKQRYEKDRFVEDVLAYFRDYAIVPKNPENLTRVISNILYRSPDVKALWFDPDAKDEGISDSVAYPDHISLEFSRIPFANDNRSILTAIRTKPFVLLAGLSGTGKSRLVRTLAFATCFDSRLQTHPTKPGNFELITVKPNWHDSTELMGYVSRIGGEKYICTAFLRFVAKAWMFPHVPFFLCLDEMNLAPVEQYFAEYLSILETMMRDGKALRSDYLLAKSQFENPALYERLLKDLGLSGKDSFAEGLSLPSNLVVIGTVNMDETTHSFSRKVLDRAMTFEMNLVDLNGGLGGEKLDWSYPERFVDPEVVLGNYSSGSEVFGLYPESQQVIDYLKRLNEVLEGTPFKIAYRVRDEFLIYCYYSSLFREESDGWLDRALDEMTAMKILSRIEGDAGKTSDVLSRFDGLLNETFAITRTKLKEMRSRLDSSGYTSFWS